MERGTELSRDELFGMLREDCPGFAEKLAKLEAERGAFVCSNCGKMSPLRRDPITGLLDVDPCACSRDGRRPALGGARHVSGGVIC